MSAFFSIRLRRVFVFAFLAGRELSLPPLAEEPCINDAMADCPSLKPFIEGVYANLDLLLSA